MATSVADAVTAIRERLDEPTAAQWTDVQLRRWLNEGLRDIARRTRLYTDQNTQAVTANLQEYTLDADILAIEHVLWAATADPNRKVPLEARAFSGVQRYVNETGSDPYFYTTYGHPPTLKVQLWPTPTRAGTLYIYGPVLPAAINVAAGGGNIDAIEAWLEVAYDYCEYMAQRKDKDAAGWKDTFSLYEGKVQHMIEQASTDDSLGEMIFTGNSLVPTWLSEFD
jgi:hypothetical protein